MGSERISIREYARRLGINEKAVRKALGAGLIDKGYDSEAKKIDPDEATAEWGYQHQIVKPGHGVSKFKAAEKVASVPSEPAATTDPVRSSPVGIPVDDAASIDLLQTIVIHSDLKTPEAIRLREIIGAAQDKLKLAETEGRLVPKDKVEKVLYALGSELKKALLNIPVRVARDVMAADNEIHAINILTEEINSVLSTYGNLRKDAL